MKNISPVSIMGTCVKTCLMSHAWSHSQVIHFWQPYLDQNLSCHIMSPLAQIAVENGWKWMKMDEEIPHLLCTDDLPVEKGHLWHQLKNLSRNQLWIRAWLSENSMTGWLVGGDWNMAPLWLSHHIGNHDPNWLIHIFQRGRKKKQPDDVAILSHQERTETAFVVVALRNQ